MDKNRHSETEDNKFPYYGCDYSDKKVKTQSFAVVTE